MPEKKSSGCEEQEVLAAAAAAAAAAAGPVGTAVALVRQAELRLNVTRRDDLAGCPSAAGRPLPHVHMDTRCP